MRSPRLVLGSLFVALLALAVVPTLGCGGGSGTPSGPAAAPTVTSVSPASGFTTGGTAITIAGTGFTGGGTPTVSVGGANAISVVVVNATTIRAVTAPTAGFGPVAVTVTNTVGAGNLPNGFTYVRFPPVADPLGDVQVDTDAMTRLGEDPQILCEGSNIYVIWIEDRNGVANDVWFNRSLDGGATWAPADTMLNTHTGIAVNRFGIRTCADGNNVYVTWVDDRSGVLQVYFSRSLDGGATWLAADVAMFHSVASQQNFQAVCCEGLSFHVVWPDDRNGPGLAALFANRSTDGGTTFLPADVAVSSPPAFDLAPNDLRLCCEGGRVVAAWSDARTGDGNAWLNRSVDGGATYQPLDTRVDSDVGAANVLNVALCCSGTNVYMAWMDDRNGMLDVYFNASLDGGVTFGADKQVNSSAPGTVNALFPSICCEGNRAHVAWVENRNAAVFEPFTRRTLDAGATFAGPDVRLNTGVAPGTVAVVVGPVGLPICCENGSVHVAWTDARNAPRLDVFLNSSPDAGATWGATDVRLDTDLPAPGDTLGAPALCCEGPIAHAAWRDDRNNLGSGQSDIAYNRTVP